jgi:hypothetical protein
MIVSGFCRPNEIIATMSQLSWVRVLAAAA